MNAEEARQRSNTQRQEQQIELMKKCRESIYNAVVNGDTFALCHNKLRYSTMEQLEHEGYRLKRPWTETWMWVVDWSSPNTPKTDARRRGNLIP